MYPRARLLVPLLFCACACVGARARPRIPGAPGQPVAKFPDKTELEALGAPEARPLPPLETVLVERWELKTSAPTPGSAYPDQSPWDRLVLEHAAGLPNSRADAALRCAAEETARFFVENGAHPDDGLRGYLLLRCGSTLANATLASIHSGVPDAVAEAEVQQHFSEGAAKLLKQYAVGAGLELGIGVARGNGRGSVALYVGAPRARLNDFSPLQTGIGAKLSGEVPADSAMVLGLVNQGLYGVKACVPDPAVALPRFQLFCPLADGDEATRIEIATRKADRVLLEVMLRTLVRRSETVGLVYEAFSYGANATATDTLAFREALRTGLAQARGAAHVPALSLEERQSLTNERLLPHLAEAAFAGDGERADRVALGLLAGWEVGAMIQNGGIFWSAVPSVQRPGRWLTYALENPIGRWVLLEPAISRVAIGAAALPPQGAMAVVTTYAIEQRTEHSADEAALLADLRARRVARGTSGPRRMESSDALRSALLRVPAESISADSALSEALSTLARQAGSQIRGWSVETHDLKQIPWPEELLAPAELDLEIGITHYKPKGGAWSQYAVLIVIH